MGSVTNAVGNVAANGIGRLGKGIGASTNRSVSTMISKSSTNGLGR